MDQLERESDRNIGNRVVQPVEGELLIMFRVGP